jgi:hypothetical protein
MEQNGNNVNNQEMAAAIDSMAGKLGADVQIPARAPTGCSPDAVIGLLSD